jgi:hypothetical protein
VTGIPRLAKQQDIAGAMLRRLADSGMVGERKLAHLLMLALTSRLLPTEYQISVAIKGASAAGKSNALDRLLETMRAEDDYINFASASPKAVIYDKRPYEHRTLVLREASGLASTDDALAYFLREMLSAGRFDHLVTETGESVKTAERGSVRITKEGPANFIVTTTLVSLEPELETRLVSVNVDES